MDPTSDDARNTTRSIVTILYFARLRQSLGLAIERVELPPGAASVNGLREMLRARGGAWTEELAPDRAVCIAVNQEMAERETALRHGDEVAFFPPVTGG